MKYILLTLIIGNLIFADDLDSFFSSSEDTIDITDEVLSEKQVLKNRIIDLKKQNTKYKIDINKKKQLIINENKVPTVYFKQPKIYTIYTREELRSWGDIDVLFNAGWKTVIVGKHRLILNNEMKIK